MKPLQSSCLCQKVKFEFQPLPNLMGHCHCRECRKSAGSAFVTSIYIQPDSLKILQGENHIQEYNHTPTLGRIFCGNCGSRLWNYGKEAESNLPLMQGMKAAHFANVTAASIESPHNYLPQTHVNINGKASWYEINDDLDRFEEFPPLEYFAAKMNEE